TSAGALAGVLAALDRIDDLEDFLLALQPDQTFRPRRLWQLPFLGLHDYALPRTVENWFGDLTALATDLSASPVELVVLATDVTDDHDEQASAYELVYSSRTTPPDVMAQAVLASGAISAFVMPLRVGDRIATDGAWVRNFPLAHAYDHPEVELIVAFHYVPYYPRLGVAARHPLRRRLTRRGWIVGPGLEAGFRTHPRWEEEEKRALIDRGWQLTDDELSAIEPPRSDEDAPYTASSGT